MSYDYDALYTSKPDALGPPSQDIVVLIDNLAPPLRVLDIGCGQGRDALFIARAGHVVTAVDISPTGIAQLVAKAEAEELPISAVTADITDFTPSEPCDVLLCDRTLHMLDEGPRHATLARLVKHIRPSGQIIIADEPSHMAGFCDVLHADDRTWQFTRLKPGLLIARGA